MALAVHIQEIQTQQALYDQNTVSGTGVKRHNSWEENKEQRSASLMKIRSVRGVGCRKGAGSSAAVHLLRWGNVTLQILPSQEFILFPWNLSPCSGHHQQWAAANTRQCGHHLQWSLTSSYNGIPIEINGFQAAR